MGWQWVLFWAAIVNAIGFVFCFFFMEETMYHRTPIIPTSDHTLEGHTKPSEMDPSVKRDTNNVNSDCITSGEIYPIKTYWQKLAPFTPLNGRPNHFFQMVWRPFPMFRFPVVLFAGFIYGCFLSWFALLNATVSIFLSSPPYNFQAAVSRFP